MKIVMLNPPYPTLFSRGSRWQASPKGVALWPPIWLIYATGVLENVGHDVKLLDCPAKGMRVEELIAILRKYGPDLITVYTSTASICNDIQVVEEIKHNLSETKICLVGPHVSIETDRTFKESPSTDFIIRKEFDYPLRDLVCSLEHGGDLSAVNNLSYRYGKSIEIKHNSLGLYIKNLDELPFASKVVKKHLDYKDYHMDYLLYPFIQIYTGRGCPHECSFCLWPQTLMGRGYRRRSLDNVFQEIDYILKELPDVKEIMIDDDTFTANPKRVQEFCEKIIQNGYKINWTVNVRSDITDINFLKLMKKAGCRCFVVGYESGSQMILDNVRKRTNVDVMLKFAKLCKKAGIQVHGDFVLGLPGETKETIKETAKAIKKLRPDTMQVSIALPLPGTRFYNWAKERGYLKTENFNNWVGEKGQQKYLVEYPELSGDEILNSMYYMLRRYFLSPGYIVRSIVRILKSPREAVKFYYAGIKFAKYAIDGYRDVNNRKKLLQKRIGVSGKTK